jgi:thiol-disulfide isomerase/thioredoxin
MVLTSLAVLALAAPQANMKAPALLPRVKAPALEVGGWLKQEAPKDQKGRFRVVEFWATWCGPCRTAMPHLTELARRYADKVDVVGVSINEYPGTTLDHIKGFVKEMGDKMDYRVAYDAPSKAMSKNWLAAAGLNAIPATFLLDDGGTVLWIGHPNGLEERLKIAFAGKTDIAANRAAFVTDLNWYEGSKAAIEKAEAAYKANRKDEAEKHWKEALTTWPRAEFMVRKSQMYAYPFGSAENTAVLDLMLKNNSVARETAIKYVMTLPESDREGAEKVIDRAIEGKPEDVLLHVAAVAYTRVKAYSKAIKAIDAAIAIVDETLADPRYEPLKEMIQNKRAIFVKAREAAVEKSRAGS